MKKRKQKNIFSGESTINFDSGVRVDRSILPSSGGLSFFNSPNNSSKGSLQRMPTGNSVLSKNKPVDSVISLKRQIKDLREMLKERDDQILAQKMSMSMRNVNESFDDRNSLLEENKRLKDHINLLQEQKGAPAKKFKAQYDKMQKELESKNKQLASMKN